MVGANLALEYSEKMRFLHAVTGLSRKALLQEALDNLFAAHAENCRASANPQRNERNLRKEGCALEKQKTRHKGGLLITRTLTRIHC